MYMPHLTHLLLLRLACDLAICEVSTCNLPGVYGSCSWGQHKFCDVLFFAFFCLFPFCGAFLYVLILRCGVSSECRHLTMVIVSQTSWSCGATFMLKRLVASWRVARTANLALALLDSL